jgi:hypothetical protein
MLAPLNALHYASDCGNLRAVVDGGGHCYRKVNDSGDRRGTRAASASALMSLVGAPHLFHSVHS